MPVTMRDVVNLLTTLNVRCSAGPLGVAFSWYFDHGNLDRERRHHYRVESGSGVAGRGHAWNVVELPEGTPRGPKVTTRHALRRQVLETLAEGPRLARATRRTRGGTPPARRAASSGSPVAGAPPASAPSAARAGT